MDLEGSIVKINQVSEKQLKEMYFLMAEFYNNITEKNFFKDFLEKDYCIILKDRENRIKGFSTQKILTLNYKIRSFTKKIGEAFHCFRFFQNFSLHMENSMIIFIGFSL